MDFLPAAKAGEGRWSVAGMTLAGPSAPGDRIEFAIRPEDLEPGTEGLEATARIVEPLGPHTLVICDVAGNLFRAVLDSGAAIGVGDRLRLAPKPDRIRWFDPETTAAL
jgi:multiple sugar transport system ATP-binding protein